MEFMGYVRPDGKVGARNYVAVIPSVTCANDVANAICHQVQGTITYLHHQGCCQMPPDLERVTDTLISLGMSPNVGAILIVSLGCEGTDHERTYKELSATGKHVEIIHIQELGGVSKAIQLGTDIARKLVIEISGLQRQPVDVSKIVMAIKCGASDTTSGMASNCVIGYVCIDHLKEMITQRCAKQVEVQLRLNEGGRGAANTVPDLRQLINFDIEEENF